MRKDRRKRCREIEEKKYLNNGIDFPSVFAMVDIRNHSSEHIGKISKAFVSRIDAVDITQHLKSRGKEEGAKSSYGADRMRVK